MKSCMIHFGLSVLLLLAIISANVVVANTENDKDKDEKEVHISPKCAAVLLTSGTVVGGTVTALAIPSLGFTSVGVAKGSLAAWWQSTMPLVKADSVFSSLQSIAMTGGVGSTVVMSGSLGGAAAAAMLTRFCKVVNDIDPQSNAGLVVETMVIGTKNFGPAWNEIVSSKGQLIEALDSIKDQVSSIEVDPGDAWSDMKDRVYNIELDPNGEMTKLWNNIKEKVNDIEIDPEGKIGQVWNTVKDQASGIELDKYGNNMEQVWKKMKEHASNIDLDPEGNMGKLWKHMKDQASSAAEGGTGSNIGSLLNDLRQRAGF